MSFNLDFYDFEIFYELYKDPFLSYNKLSKLISISPSTVRERIFSMKQKGFLRPDGIIRDPILGERKITEVIATYNPLNIGLVKHHLFLDGIPDNKKLELLIKFCDEHPYTHYRSNSFGMKGKSLYIEFEIPPSIEKSMIKLYNSIKNVLDLHEIRIFRNMGEIHNLPDFRSWISLRNRNKGMNNLAVNFHASLLKSWNEFNQNDKMKKMKNNFQFDDFVLTDLDAKLLRELSINAKPSITDMSNFYQRDKSVISRHISKLKKSVISRGTIIYDFNTFGFDNYQIITGEFKSSNLMNLFTNFILSNPLPLKIDLSLDQNKYLLYIVGSSSFLFQFLDLLWSISKSNEFITSQLIPNSFFRYYFYNKNYSQDSGWNIDLDYHSTIPFQIFN